MIIIKDVEAEDMKLYLGSFLSMRGRFISCRAGCLRSPCCIGDKLNLCFVDQWIASTEHESAIEVIRRALNGKSLGVIYISR